MWNEYSVAAHWPGEFDEAALQKWAEELRNQLHAPRVSLGVVFMTPKFFPHAAQVLELFRVHARIPLLVVGGLASGEPAEQRTQVYLNGEIFDEGGVAVAVGGEVRLASVISQGCTPIGETWTITKAERNLIHEIGNRPAYEVLAETFNQLPQTEQAKSRGNLFVGLVINEYLEEFGRGDFLIRNLIGGDAKSGTLA